MIDPALIKWNYSTLSDGQLLLLATKERHKLSYEVLGILGEEFKKRGLDASFFIKASPVDEQYNVENTNAATATINAWDFAFKERCAGKTDKEIIDGLMMKRFGAAESLLIIKRLPQTNFINENFEGFIFKSCENSMLQSYFILLALFGIAGYFFYLAIAYQNLIALLPALTLGAAGLYLIQKCRGYLKGGQYWVDMIKEQPDNIVWIKPIVEKHTVAYVVTIFKEKKFQFLTKDRLVITMDCNSLEQQQLFFDGVKDNLPHAQIGYSYKMEDLYDDSPKTFLSSLQRAGIYTPLDKIKT